MSLTRECALSLENLAKGGQQACRPEGFWVAIDTLRARDICLLKQLWESGERARFVLEK